MTFGSSCYGSVEYGGLIVWQQQYWLEQIKLDSPVNRSLAFSSPIDQNLIFNSSINKSLILSSLINKSMALNSPTNKMIARTSIIEIVEDT